MIGRRRGRGNMSLGRVAKKAAVATVVNRVVSNAMDNRMGNNVRQQQPMQQAPIQSQQMVMNSVCPSCQTANPQHAKFCSNCGSGFATPQAQQEVLSNCPGCKASLAGISGNFCPYCRAAIR